MPRPKQSRNRSANLSNPKTQSYEEVCLKNGDEHHPMAERSCLGNLFLMAQRPSVCSSCRQKCRRKLPDKTRRWTLSITRLYLTPRTPILPEGHNSTSFLANEPAALSEKTRGRQQSIANGCLHRKALLPRKRQLTKKYRTGWRRSTSWKANWIRCKATRLRETQCTLRSHHGSGTCPHQGNRPLAPKGVRPRMYRAKSKGWKRGMKAGQRRTSN
jgi:hypothetical protein